MQVIVQTRGIEQRFIRCKKLVTIQENLSKKHRGSVRCEISSESQSVEVSCTSFLKRVSGVLRKSRTHYNDYHLTTVHFKVARNDENDE